jgi:hypothetical protein
MGVCVYEIKSACGGSKAFFTAGIIDRYTFAVRGRAFFPVWSGRGA